MRPQINSLLKQPYTRRTLMAAVLSSSMLPAARADYEIFLPGGASAIGKVTSGVLSPTLGYPIAMAYLKADLDLAPGTALEADVRGTRIPYEIVKLPFYKAER